MQEARQSEKKRKSRKFPGIGDEKKACGTDSRSSTPSDKLPSAPASIASVERGGGRKTKGGNTRTVPMQEVVEPPKKEIRIEMPPTLMELLVDDYDMITRQMHLTKLPARLTVEQIIKQYSDYVKNTLPDYKESTILCGRHEVWLRMDALIDCALGIQDFFNATLGARLLYKFEYLQYDRIIDEKIKNMQNDAGMNSQITDDSSTPLDDPALEKKWKPADTYGFIYLLRLLVRFGSLLGICYREANWEEQGERSVVSTLEYIGRFIKFLDENRHDFFDVQKDYVLAPADYQKRYTEVYTL
uniref:MRG domain-containing protein n=1 Tax=Syphacia muris TaxID=451379 RepID=A0A0N5ACB8_9BILA